MSLTRLEKNEIYKAITASDLDPAECSLAEVGGEGSQIFEIRHNNSGSTYTFSTEMIGRHLGYTVKYHVVDGNDVIFDTEHSINRLTISIRNWADEIKRTFDAPDLWAEMQNSRGLIADIQQEDTENTPFTQDEQRQIAAQLQAIKKQIAERFELSSEQMERVEERLDEAAEASKRMKRKDWLLLFGGIIFTLIIAGTVTPDIADHIFTMVIQGITHLFIGRSEPPQIPPQPIA